MGNLTDISDAQFESDILKADAAAVKFWAEW